MTGTIAVDPDEPELGAELELRMRVNGRSERVRARAHHTLVDVLRDQLALTGVREGCGVGSCGACTVLLDGEPVSGCLVLAPLADGREVVTVEGLETPDGALDPVQEAFVRHTAFQCSFCTPGFLLAANALLTERPAATDDEIVEHLRGNLCRCGSYSRIRAAVADVRDGLASGAGGRP
jgi:carbon-monoxide dehydrogenase small subunit/isoquinoline 1-oxidoreductase alpha subunit/xanthine dehydrogenase YagT iron-sulfur-binding subunit